MPNKDDKFNVRFERAEAKLADCIQQQENALWQERKVGKRRDDHTKALAIAAATPREKQNPQQRMTVHKSNHRGVFTTAESWPPRLHAIDATPARCVAVLSLIVRFSQHGRVLAEVRPTH